MYITCLDMEGVLVPEIWIAFAEASGIPALKRKYLVDYCGFNEEDAAAAVPDQAAAIDPGF